MFLAFHRNGGANVFLGIIHGAGRLVDPLREVPPCPPYHGIQALSRAELSTHGHGEIFLHTPAVFPQNQEGQSRSRRSKEQNRAAGDPRQDGDEPPQTILAQAVPQPVEELAEEKLLPCHRAPCKTFYTLFSSKSPRDRAQIEGRRGEPAAPSRRDKIKEN